MTALFVVAVSFLAMEVVSYASHRWLMHGPGMGWHRSHHLPPTGRYERNDLFPLCFSMLGVAAFAAAALFPSLVILRWVAIGVTLYGAAYLFVHEIVIHERMRVPLPPSTYLEWLRSSHRIHHLFGGEPYGMLVPFVRRSVRLRASLLDREPLDRASAPASRIRL